MALVEVTCGRCGRVYETEEDMLLPILGIQDPGLGAPIFTAGCAECVPALPPMPRGGIKYPPLED